VDLVSNNIDICQLFYGRHFFTLLSLETRWRMLGPKSRETLASTYGLCHSLDGVALNFGVLEEYSGLELGQEKLRTEGTRQGSKC